MPIETRVRTPFAPALDLPPPFRLVTLREAGDAFARAQTIAADEGAGTLVWVGRFDLVEFAVVLEPEEPLRAARRAFYAGMTALADALAVHAPPEKPIAFDWPDAVRVDGGLIGGGRLAWPSDAREDKAPPWLVFGATVRTVAMTEAAPGLRVIEAALEDEGFDDLGSGRLVASFARQLMVLTDAWQESGFAVVAQSYLARLPAEAGVERTIDGVGDLLLRRRG
ncbi:MAG TPA: biotin/lipoate--protein ligase family protein, partial [Xanthobacteraceae bacterium]|nr:biotin/lipoate--protein ligase family protein [Xanthobacteraceae bacterium]